MKNNIIRQFKKATLNQDELNDLWRPLKDKYGLGDSELIKISLRDKIKHDRLSERFKAVGIDLEIFSDNFLTIKEVLNHEKQEHKNR